MIYNVIIPSFKTSGNFFMQIYGYMKSLWLEY